MEIPGYLYDISPAGDRAVLCVQEPGVTPDRNTLWVTDGTDGGTRPLAGAPPAFGCGVSSDLPTAGRLLFLAHDWALWGTDGTAAGTSEIHAFGEVPASGGPLSQIALNGQLLFAGRTSEDEAPLFISDGTAGGTRQISQRAGPRAGARRREGLLRGLGAGGTRVLPDPPIARAVVERRHRRRDAGRVAGHLFVPFAHARGKYALLHRRP
jgi:hypothetical protein